jgi:hypothetical protein
MQLIMFCGFLELRTDKNEGNWVSGKVPGNVQPETAMFKAPGDNSIRAKEINNGKSISHHPTGRVLTHATY